MSTKIKTRCPSCQVKINAPVSLLGKKAKCPKCGNTFDIVAEESELPLVEFEEIKQSPKINLEQMPPAHLLFLTAFLYPTEVSSISAPCGRNYSTVVDTADWQKVLGESPQSVVNRFLQEGLIAPVDLAVQLDRRFYISVLKQMLKERSLPTSGRKKDLIERLIQSDSEGMKETVSKSILYQCTTSGRKIAEEFLSIEKEKRFRVEQKVYDALKKRMFNKASNLVALFEAEQIFPRGLNIDWRNHNTDHDTVILNYIFNRKPKILGQISGNCLEHLRIACGMMYLWGVNGIDDWLPAGMEWGLRMNESTAGRMLLFHAYFLRNMDGFRETSREMPDLIAGVSISVTCDSDTCDNCRSIRKELVKLSDVPELPYEQCTNIEDGCRCSVTMVDKYTIQRGVSEQKS